MTRTRRSVVCVLAVSVALAVAGPASADQSLRIAAGGGHTCALKIDDSIVCWGLNNHGQATPPVGAFSAVSAGSLNSCAIRADGTVACWGKKIGRAHV